MAKQIPLGNGKFAVVDDEDFERLSAFKWHCSGQRPHVYATRTLYLGGGRHRPRFAKIFMHRLLMGTPPCQVDHKNRDTLDNRKENLRLANSKKNAQNRKVRADSATGYKGVYWRAGRNKYRVVIRSEGKSKVVGHFSDPVQAARAYDKAALELFGEYACLNFPQNSSAPPS